MKKVEIAQRLVDYLITEYKTNKITKHTYKNISNSIFFDIDYISIGKNHLSTKKGNKKNLLLEIKKIFI